MLDMNAMFTAVGGQAFTASGASTYDLVVPKAHKLQASSMALEFRVVEAFNNLTSATLSIQSTTEDDSDWEETPITEITSRTLLAADLVAGARFNIAALPPVSGQRIRFYLTIDGPAPTTGKLWGGVIVGPPEVGFEDGFFFSPRNPSGAASGVA